MPATTDASALLRRTAVFFLGRVARELRQEIDLRARGEGRHPLVRAALYLWALLRDIARIPLHDPRGIGQARFRSRVLYIREVACPTLEFFRDQYPLGAEAETLLERALGHLERGASLLTDGPFPALDEWYATMGEFHALTDACVQAAASLEELTSSLPDPTDPPARARETPM